MPIHSLSINHTTYMSLGIGLSFVTVAAIATLLWPQFLKMQWLEPTKLENQPDHRFPWLEYALLLMIVLRIWAVLYMNTNWFIQDDAFDACIMPFQMSHNEPIWGGGTNYLTYLSYLAIYRLFDFSVRAASAVNATVFILSFIMIATAVRRELGTTVAFFVVAICAASYPLIVHSTYATAITFAFLPLGVMLTVLTRPAGVMSGAILSLSLAVSLFLYPGGTLVGVSLVASHALLMPIWWNVRAWIGLGVGGVLGGVGAYLVRHSLASSGKMTQWAGGYMQFDVIGSSTWVVLKDTLWHSTSWNTYNDGVPYFEPMWLGWLICGFFFLTVAVARRQFGTEERWLAIAFLVFFGSAVLSAMTGVYPGVRRIVSAIPFLYLVCAIIFARLWQQCQRPWPILALVVISWALMLVRTVTFASSNWPLSRGSEFIAESLKMLQDVPARTRKVVIFSDLNDQFKGLEYRCSLGLTRSYTERFDPPEVMSRDSIDSMTVSGKRRDPFIKISTDDLPQPAPPEQGIRGNVYVSKTPLTTLRPLFGAKPDFEIITNSLSIPETVGILTLSDGQNLKGGDNVRIVFTGKWHAEGSAETLFRVRADDGCRLYLDGKMIVDYNGVHAFGEETVSKPLLLGKGPHSIVVDYFEWGGNAGLSVEWKGTGGQFKMLQSGAMLP